MSQFSEIVIWDQPGDPKLSEIAGKLVVFWQGYETSHFKWAVSIPQLVETNADLLRSRYLSWIFKLGQTQVDGKTLLDCLEIRSGLSYWWMTLLTEKCNWAKSPYINDVIRLFAFTRWVGSRQINRIKLVSGKPELAQALKLWCKMKNVAFKWRLESKNSNKPSHESKLHDALPQLFQATVWLLRYVIQRLPLKGTGLRQWQKGRGEILFVSYLFNLLPKNIEKGKYACNFWGNLPNRLSKKKYKTRWLHHYIPNKLLPNAKKAALSLKNFNYEARAKQSHACLDSFINLKAIFRILRDWINLVFYGWRFKKKLIRSFGYLAPLFIKDWHKSFFGITAISNLLHLNLCEEAMKNLPKQKIGFYLQENQPWEIAFIHAWKKAGHGKLVGVPHSTVRFWDLRYFSDKRIYCEVDRLKMPRPDLVAVNGPVMRQAYLKGRYPKKEIIAVEALRFLHLEKNRKCLQNVREKNSILRLLVLGEYLNEGNQLILSVLSAAFPLINKNISITFKSHPACSVNLNNYPKLKIKPTSEPVSQILSQHDVVLSGPVTTAAVEAYFLGLPVVTILNSSSLNLSPLKKTRGVHFVVNGEELSTFLNFIARAPKRKSNKINFFYLNGNLSSWENIIKSKNFKKK